MSRLRTYAPMDRVSKKRAAGMKPPKGWATWARGEAKRLDEIAGLPLMLRSDPVYAKVDARSEGRCEVTLDGARCRKAMQDRHHTVKPRESHHAPEYVMAICRAHHDRCDYPFKRGRLIIAPLMDGTFICGIVTAPDKFTYRQRAASGGPGRER